MSTPTCIIHLPTPYLMSSLQGLNRGEISPTVFCRESLVFLIDPGVRLVTHLVQLKEAWREGRQGM